jgi:hypothetical protein
MSLSDIKVGTKLVSGFLSVAMIVAAIGALGIVNLDRLIAVSDELLGADMELTDSSMEANISPMDIRDLTAEGVFEDDPGALAWTEKEILEFDAKAVQAMDYLAKSDRSGIANQGREALHQESRLRQGALELLRLRRVALDAKHRAGEVSEEYRNAQQSVLAMMHEPSTPPVKRLRRSSAPSRPMSRTRWSARWQRPTFSTPRRSVFWSRWSLAVSRSRSESAS